jgi:hypothetical protein
MKGIDPDVEKTLADPKHPIWKFLASLVVLLTILHTNGNM